MAENEDKLTGINGGKPDVWARFFAEHDPAIRAVISWRRWRFPPDVREEVHQAVRTSMPAAMGRYKHDAPLAVFIKRITIHRCVDEIRSRAPRRARFIGLGDADPAEFLGEEAGELTPTGDALSEIVRQELAGAARRALERLDADSAELIRDYYFNGMKYREIAAKRGISAGAVAGKLARSLCMFRKICLRDPVLADYMTFM